ncbi:FecCD family ABC transporter permease [Jiangella alkaliphila]|uniref:Iron complex transport system permease protein n=1 Tax=Jiangella alkaliphila TaxID=419479 RepID=A0A1H2LCD3_9ACTN|nr:iron ABC transporter permease [Jiangella alkaliphila]SDU78278.1 iron complex transport system permease protein [Jiangella alkaliphila]
MTVPVRSRAPAAPPAGPVRRSTRRSPRTAAVLAALVVLLVLGVLLLLGQGSVRIPLGDVASVLAGGEASRDVYETVILDARAPKAIAAVLAGAALAVGGAQMQTLFRNPLADPFVLGVSSGAELGAAIVILGSTGTGWLFQLGVLSQLGVTGAAVVGSGLVLVLALAVAQRVASPVTVLIVGIMFGYLAGAIVDVLVYYTEPERLQSLAGFTRGTVRDVSWDDLAVLAPVCGAGVLLSLALARPLNVLLLGERYAATMGIPVRAVQRTSLVAVAVLAGVTTAYCGVIGFIGLAAPHLVRALLRTSNHLVVLPASALMGAVLVLAAEYVAGGNGLTDTALPLNSVTAFIGAPVVLWVLLRRRRDSAQVPA